MWLVPLGWITTLVFLLFFGLELDMGKTFLTQVFLQGGMDASTLAGTTQQNEIASQYAPNGAPTKFAWVVKQDGSPQTVANQTWTKNVTNWPGGIGNAAAGTQPPVFNVTKYNASTPTGMVDTVAGTVSQTVQLSFSNKNIGTNAQVTVTNNAAATVPPTP